MPVSPKGFSTAPSRMPVANRPAPPARQAPMAAPTPAPRSSPMKASVPDAFGRNPLAYNRKVAGFKNGGCNKKCNAKW